jgi:AraC family transcriptional regulator of adaptative response/methylated-DNA-[protein]-cysteine methyltransferase
MGVGVSDGAICFLAFGEGKAHIIKACAEYYSHANITWAPHEVAHAASLLADWFAGKPLPQGAVSVCGTPFQTAVWRQLSAIPRGKTLSYAEVAKRIGNPKAVRAVGTACGANPVSLLIPCHRVLTSDGKLGGYAWGTHLKKQLLALENVA